MLNCIVIANNQSLSFTHLEFILVCVVVHYSSVRPYLKAMGFYNAKCTSNARLDGKTVVITGCNTGIGKETVQDFYRRGNCILK